MIALRTFLERLLGPHAGGQIPGRPDDRLTQERIDRAVRQIQEIERDVFTDQLRRAWKGGEENRDH